jgi:hypothetical protein
VAPVCARKHCAAGAFLMAATFVGALRRQPLLPEIGRPALARRTNQSRFGPIGGHACRAFLPAEIFRQQLRQGVSWFPDEL